jgi:hypothetical protein
MRDFFTPGSLSLKAIAVIWVVGFAAKKCRSPICDTNQLRKCPRQADETCGAASIKDQHAADTAGRAP